MKKSIVYLLHLLYWSPKLVILLVAAISLIFMKPGKGLLEPFLLQMDTFLPTIICFYIFYLLLFPKFLEKEKILPFILWGIITWLTLSGLSLLMLKISPFKEMSDKLLTRVWESRNIPGILTAGIIGSLFRGFITWYSEIRVKEQLIQKNLRSELALLKSQINPHFLFNTINNIDVLIERDTKAASAYLKKLSEIMRFMLYDVSSDFIPLAKELEYIQKYIDLQKIRTSNEKYVNYEIKGNDPGILIAPAIFIPFIENAFKHSTNKKIEDAITITIEIKESDVTFHCINYFDNSKSTTIEKSGLGIDLISQRLQLLYKDEHTLITNKIENIFDVTLIINFA